MEEGEGDDEDEEDDDDEETDGAVLGLSAVCVPAVSGACLATIFLSIFLGC